MTSRNLDYGSIASNSKEGEIAKKTLISMGKDLYNLYIHLNDEDDPTVKFKSNVVVEPSAVSDCFSNAPYAGFRPMYAIFYPI